MADGGPIRVCPARGPIHTIAAIGNVVDGGQPVIAWSPDSRYLPYTGLTSDAPYDTGGALRVIDPSTGKARRLANPLPAHATVGDIAWLPHDRLGFATRSTFYEVTADWHSAGPLSLRMDTIGQDGSFAASPDGKLLAYVATGAAGHYQMVLATSDGHQRVQFTQPTGPTDRPSSPRTARPSCVCRRSAARQEAICSRSPWTPSRVASCRCSGRRRRSITCSTSCSGSGHAGRPP